MENIFYRFLTHKISLQVRDPLLAAADIALQIGSHLLLLIKLDLWDSDVFLEFIETLLGLLQLVPLRLQLALELLLLADLGVETILKRKKSKLLKNGALPIA